MIIFILMLLAFCVIHFTRFLIKQKMWYAAVGVALLYVVLLVWAYFIFELDFLKMGLTNESSFASLADMADQVPVHAALGFKAIYSVISLAIVATSISIIHGLFEITKAVISIIRRLRTIRFFDRVELRVVTLFNSFSEKKFAWSVCRMNC